MKNMVDMWRESVRSSLERVLERVKEWETVSAKWNAENTAQLSPTGSGIAMQKEDVQKIEAQVRHLFDRLIFVALMNEHVTPSSPHLFHSV